jgi:type IV secretion system protein VirD4
MTAVLLGAWRLAIALVALPFALIGWLWTCARTAGSGALLGGILALLWDAVILLEPPHPRHAAIGLLLGGLAGLGLALTGLFSYGRGSPGASHGSAAWASPPQR